MLNGKTIVLGVTGSIAAYKIANLASMLVKLHADVHVIMTRNACNFITTTTFETLTGNKCLVDTFDRNFEFQVEHVSIAKKADVFLVAPASANIIGKLAHGICDDMLTTTIFATRASKLVSPAMNTGMWENPILQDNLNVLRRYGFGIITPDSGRLACGDVGSGKMPSEEVLLQHILTAVAMPHDLEGRRILITAGPTQEAIDPVRFITNHSSGKMGYAIAKMARLRGAEVTIVSGPVSVKPFLGVEVVPVVSAEQMYCEVTGRAQRYDIIIMCSAVADYTPLHYSDQKIKKMPTESQSPLSPAPVKCPSALLTDMKPTTEMKPTTDAASLPLTRTKDILQYLGDHKAEGQLLVGFSMETENLIANSRSKLERKNADFICANSISTGETGFAVDTNRVTIISRDGIEELPLCSKEETATLILNHITA